MMGASTMKSSERRVKEMTVSLDFPIQELERKLPNTNRVTLSNLRHSKEWLPLVSEHRMVEVISGSDTVAMLNDPKLIMELIQVVKSQKNEIEKLKINALYAERLHYSHEFKNSLEAEDETMMYLQQLLDGRVD